MTSARERLQALKNETFGRSGPSDEWWAEYIRLCKELNEEIRQETSQGKDEIREGSEVWVRATLSGWGADWACVTLSATSTGASQVVVPSGSVRPVLPAAFTLCPVCLRQMASANILCTATPECVTYAEATIARQNSPIRDDHSTINATPKQPEIIPQSLEDGPSIDSSCEPSRPLTDLIGKWLCRWGLHRLTNPQASAGRCFIACDRSHCNYEHPWLG